MDDRAHTGSEGSAPLARETRAALSFLSRDSVGADKAGVLDYLKSGDVEDGRAARPFRLPVKSVDRSMPGARAVMGTIASGGLWPGDEVAVLPGGRTTTIKTISKDGTETETAGAGDAVTVTLTDDLDVAPGDMLAAARARPQVADQFAAHLVWMSNDRLQPGRSYIIQINNNTAAATVTEIKHRLDVDSLAQLAAKSLASNEAGVCNLSVARPIAFDAFVDNRETGAFILVDRYSNETVAAGMIDFALRRASNIHHQHLTVSRVERAQLMNHKPAVLWFTGLSGAGKSTTGLTPFVENKRGLI